MGGYLEGVRSNVLTGVQIEQVLKFLRENGRFKGTDDQLREIISKHSDYNTIEVVWRGEEILACCRYNIDQYTCAVIDATVKKSYRGKQLLKLMLLMGLQKYPLTKTIKYMRGYKVRKEERVFDINKFLNIKELNATS